MSFQTFKGCLPQILLGPFLNILPHLFHAILSALFPVLTFPINMEIWRE